MNKYKVFTGDEGHNIIEADEVCVLETGQIVFYKKTQIPVKKSEKVGGGIEAAWDGVAEVDEIVAIYPSDVSVRKIIDEELVDTKPYNKLIKLPGDDLANNILNSEYEFE